MDKVKTVYECITAMVTAWPNAKITPQTVDLYADMLGDLAPSELQMAVKDLIATAKFFPTIAEIRERVTAHRIRRADVPLALEAWGEVVRAIGTVGSYGIPRWSTPLIGESLRAVGGWTNLCLSEEGLMSWRARFVEIYDGLMNRARHDDEMIPAVRQAVLPNGSAMKSIGQLMSGKGGEEKRKPAHTIYRAPTEAEKERGDYKTVEEIKGEATEAMQQAAIARYLAAQETKL